MCCRFYTDDTTKKDIISLVSAYDRRINWLREGDVHPGDPATVITAGGEALYAMDMRWSEIFNARSETVQTKKMFAESYEKRRCVIPARHFYEWDREKNRVQFTVEGERSVYLAGIYMPASHGSTVLTSHGSTALTSHGSTALTSHGSTALTSHGSTCGAAMKEVDDSVADAAPSHRDADGTPPQHDSAEGAVMEFTLLTASPGESMKPVHDRQPLVLREDEIRDWILDSGRAAELLEKPPAEFSLYREYEQLSFLDLL